MSFIFVTYSNHLFAERMHQQLDKADSLGMKTRGYTREWLEQTDFYKQHQHILDQPRGDGYWLWKPFVILDAVNQADPGDIIFYMDSGDDYDPLVLDYVSAVIDPDAPGLLTSNGWPLRKFCKRDCYVYTGCDSQEYYNLNILEAGISFWNVNESAKQALKIILEYTSNEVALTDIPNQSGLPELAGFIDHRHDQSILTLLSHKYHWPQDAKLLTYFDCNVWTPNK